MCTIIFQTLTHVFHSSKQIPLSVYRHQLSSGGLPGGYGWLPDNLDVAGSLTHWLIVLRTAYEGSWNCVHLLRTKQAIREANGPASPLRCTPHVARRHTFQEINCITHTFDWTSIFSEKAQAEYANLANRYTRITCRSTATFPHFSVKSIFSNAWYLRKLELPWKRSSNCWTAVSTSRYIIQRRVVIADWQLWQHGRRHHQCFGGLRWRGTCNASKSISATTFASVSNWSNASSSRR